MYNIFFLFFKEPIPNSRRSFLLPYIRDVRSGIYSLSRLRSKSPLIWMRRIPKMSYLTWSWIPSWTLVFPVLMNSSSPLTRPPVSHLTTQCCSTLRLKHNLGLNCFMSLDPYLLFICFHKMWIGLNWTTR